MMEIERKFLVKKMPDLSSKKCVSYERYFLAIQPDFEDRIQKRADRYEREKKFKRSDLTRTTEKTDLTKTQFDELKRSASKSIIRDSYLISDSLSISIKVYHGDYEGLVRAEIEFSSEEEARSFKPLVWMGREITNTSLGKDSKLLLLDKKRFKMILNSLQHKSL